MKKFLVSTLMLLIGIAIANFVLELALEKTSRRFSEEFVMVEKNLLLVIAANTYDLPRIYRRKTSYDDAHELVHALPHLKGKQTEQTWGIAKALNITKQVLNQYQASSDNYFYTLQKQISIFNRLGIKEHQKAEVAQKVAELLQSSQHFSTEQKAYAHIEHMLFLANTQQPQADIATAYQQAVQILETEGSNPLNAHKFAFYYGYAKCVAGDPEGAAIMNQSKETLAQKSAMYQLAMLLNWDLQLGKNLRTAGAPGNAVCGAAMTK